MMRVTWESKETPPARREMIRKHDQIWAAFVRPLSHQSLGRFRLGIEISRCQINALAVICPVYHIFRRLEWSVAHVSHWSMKTTSARFPMILQVFLEYQQIRRFGASAALNVTIHKLVSSSPHDARTSCTSFGNWGTRKFNALKIGPKGALSSHSFAVKEGWMASDQGFTQFSALLMYEICLKRSLQPLTLNVRLYGGRIFMANLQMFERIWWEDRGTGKGLLLGAWGYSLREIRSRWALSS